MFELGTDGPRLILVGVDGSPSSLNACSYAVGLARRQASALMVIHVAPVLGGPTAWAAASGAVVPLDVGTDKVDELEHLVRSRTGDSGVALDFVRRSGDPYDAIVKAADDSRVDAIVVGASRQAGHRIVGSIAGRVVRNKRWPVTVVP